MASITGPISVCVCSGSRSTTNSVELLMSANSTVTCFRSPSRAALEVRIFSARCRGVYSLGEAKSGDSSATGCRGWPHCAQNLAVLDAGLPQLVQTLVSGAAHCSQNFASMSLSCRQLGHSMEAKRAERRRTKTVAPNITRNNLLTCSPCRHRPADAGEDDAGVIPAETGRICRRSHS